MSSLYISMPSHPAPQHNLPSDCYLCPAHPTNPPAQMHTRQEKGWPWEDGNAFTQYVGTFLFNYLLTQHSTAVLISICVIHSPTTVAEEDLPQMISRAHRVTSRKTSNGSLSTCFSSFSNKIPPCSFITSRKSVKIAKWNVGVIIFLRDLHFSPVLQN